LEVQQTVEMKAGDVRAHVRSPARERETMTKSIIPHYGKQCRKILALLRKAGHRGVSKKFLIFEMGITQAGARIFELESIGYQIRHEKRHGQKFVTFILEPSPTKRLSPTARERNICKTNGSGDPFELPPGKASSKPEISSCDLPLFRGIEP